MALRWYVARTEPRAEFLAAKELNRDGYEVFSPRVRAYRPLVELREAPLFPGYLFLRCDPESDGWPVFRPGHRVLGWVSFGNQVPSIPDQVVQELVERLNGIDTAGGLWRRFSPGELVQVLSGTLDSFAQVVEAPKSPEGRAKVLMEFMGRLVQAQVPWQNLRPVENSEMEKQRLPRRTRGKGRWIATFGPHAVAST